jgi:hypothetical protein
MNKNNVIELCDYKKNKDKVEHEHRCFSFLDSLKDRINMPKLYATNFRNYIETMVKDGNIKKEFAENLNLQVDMIVAEFSETIARKV